MITAPKAFSLIFLLAGVFLLALVALPIISFEILEISQKYSSNISLISPSGQKDSSMLGVSIKTDDNFSYFVSRTMRTSHPVYDYFNISIPSLKIDQAKVLVDSNDLSKTLAHLPGTALPGERGNVFISGHSAVTAILSIQNAIFAKLPEVKRGEQITVEAGGVKYKYKIVDIKIVAPTDVSVINPPDSGGRYISLMTCVPPGLNTKRLVAIGKII